MDPIAAIAIINDPDNYDMLDREEALEGLAEWVATGGAVPFDASLVSARHLPDWLQNTVAAINCAIANADLSGLVGLGYDQPRL